MRIRKRDIPLPLSSLSPIPLSDPLFHGPDHHPPVQLSLLPTAKPPPPPVPRPIPSSTNDFDRLPKEELVSDYSPELRDGMERGVVGVVSEKNSNSNHSRDLDNAERSTSGSSPSANSPSISCEAQTMALNKRRLSSSGEVDGDENKMETKTKASSNSSRRRGRGGGVGEASMEGSRCSRVNGRGWRCGQQTLVGYSLCEHHLGKGRLRSMMNVRSRSMIGAREASGKGYEKLEAMNQPTCIDPEPSLPSVLEEGNSLMYNNEGEDDDDEEEDSAANGKKKARSMSSLLGQSPNHGDKGGVSTLSFIVE